MKSDKILHLFQRTDKNIEDNALSNFHKSYLSFIKF